MNESFADKQMVPTNYSIYENILSRTTLMTITYQEIEAKSILRKHSKLDSWFVSRYGMNLYRGCVHDCIYCDGRAEKYNVTEDFGSVIAIKKNAVEVLARELDPARKRVPLKKGFIMVGGGVGDGYQPAEKSYRLTRSVLELLLEHNFPIHILTKSTLVERDLDLITKINDKTRAIVSFSFSSAHDAISSVLEPGASLPSEKLATISRLKNEGITSGMFLMPVVPFLTDSAEILEESIAQAKNAGIDFLIFSGMTLKEGKQKEHFYSILTKHYPHLIPKYNSLYQANKWGGVNEEYSNQVHKTFLSIVKKYNLPLRIPAHLFKDYVDENDLVALILDQMDYLAKLQEKSSPYGYAAYSVSQLTQPISEIQDHLKSLKGVGTVTERIILEILQTGTSEYYKKLLVGDM